MEMEKGLANIVMRRAKMSDVGAILVINRKLYYGFDILQVIYPSMIQSVNHAPYVGLIDGKDRKEVAFINFYIINDGTATCAMSSRMADEYQAQGLYTRDFSRKALIDILSKQPSVKCFTLHSDQKNALLFTTTIQGIQAAINDLGQHEDQSRPLSTSESLKLIQDGSMVSMFKSKSDWFICTPSWIPLLVTANNLTFAVKTCDTRGTFENGRLIAVSFGAHIQAVQCPLAIMQLTCDTLNQCQGHIQAFMRHVLTMSAHDNQQVTLSVHFPLTIDIKAIQDQLVPHLGQTLNSQFRNNRTDGVLITDVVPSKL